MAVNILGENWSIQRLSLPLSVIQKRSFCTKKNLKRPNFVYCSSSNSTSFVLGKNSGLEKVFSANLSRPFSSTTPSILQRKLLRSDSAFHIHDTFELPRYLDGNAKLLQKLFQTVIVPKNEVLKKDDDEIYTFKAVSNRLNKPRHTTLNPQKTAQCVIDEILNGHLHPSHTQACNLLSFLAEGTEANQTVHNMDKLVSILFNVVTSKIDHLNIDLVAGLVTKCAQRCEGGEDIFYNAEFMNSLPIHDIRIIKAAARMGHVNDDFLLRVSSPMHLEKKLMNLDWLMAYVHLFGTAGKLPPRHNKIFPHEHFMDHSVLNHADKSIHSPHILVQLTLDLLAMGCKPPFQFLKKIFRPYPSIKSYTDCGLTNVGYGPIPLLLIAFALRHLHPDPTLEGILPSAKFVEELEDAARSQGINWRHPIQKNLEYSFGGPSNVLTDLWHDGVHIDHCIILYAKDGLALHFNKKFVFPKQFPDQLPIFLKVHPRHHYVANMERLRGVYELESKTLHSFGLPVMDIDLQKWNELAEADRFNWLVNHSIEHCWHHWGEALRHALSTFSIKFKKQYSKKEYGSIDRSYQAEGV